MVNVLRRWSQPIMVLVTVLVIVSFTYFGQNYYGQSAGKEVVATVDGTEITRDVFLRQSRRVGIFAALRGNYIQSLGLAMMFGQQPGATEVAKSFVLEREMDRFGLTATEDEKLEVLKNLPSFAGPDGFDPTAYQIFKERVLNPQGFSEADFDQIFLAGEVRAKKLQEIVGSTVTASNEEVRNMVLRQKQKTEASYVAFRRDDFRKDVKVTEEEVKKRFEEQKDLYKTPELRKVRYAAFLVPATADNKPLDTKERTAQLQKLADAAYAFTEELAKTKGNFAELAAKHGAKVEVTKEFFDADSAPDELEGSPEAAQAAFALTKENPVSAYIQLQKGIYVLELAEVKAPEPRKFEDVKGEIEGTLILAKAEELARNKANEVRGKLADSMKAGKTFADAAKELGLKVEQAPSFGGGQRSTPGEFGQVVSTAAAKLAPGEISEVVSSSTNNAALIVHVDYRSEVPDKEIADARPAMARQIEDGMPPFRPGMRTIVFQNWLVERAEAAGLGSFLRSGPDA
jgi:peptidyl-prolyl cis-trans isomerase D